ncbi:MAG TPA: matrixin family metalloprotease [Candidatus Acidoferrales bacterium]|nr:matrixin family metalloprotease [Candidatus Acidoferrales bacterium]
MRSWTCALAALTILAAGRVDATTFVPLSIEELARGSVATVIGTVTEVRAVQSHRGAIYTLVTIAVEEVVQGQLSAAVITLKEDGGVLGGRSETVFGAPRYRAGERVLVFLTVRPDGSLRTTQLALGKFALEVGAAGMPQARQDLGPSVMLMVPHGAAAPPALRAFSDLLSIVRRTDAPAGAATRFVTQPMEATDASLRTEISPAFMIGDTGRFFEPDEGTPLSFVIDQRGDSALGLDVSRQSVDDALAAWTNVPTATVELEDDGLTAVDISAPCPGPNVILFDDPNGEIPAPTECHGTLALAASCSSTFELKHFNGMTFQRTLRGTVTFASGWDGCAVWNACNLGEIATHELGHVIGLAHSSNDPNETNPTLKNATMYFMAHFDGRCAQVETDDEAGVSFIYPTPIPPTITTQDPLPLGAKGVSYNPNNVPLTAMGGTGSFTWSLVGGGFPGLSLSADGVLSGAPTTGGSGFFQIKATDGNGDSHTKVLNITVLGPIATATRTATLTLTPTPTATASVTPTATASPTATVTPTSTPSPTATASTTPTASPTATATATFTPTPSLTPSATIPPTATTTPTPPCPGDCDRSGEVTVNELLTMINIALNNASLASCSAGDVNHDGVITVDEILAAVNAALKGCHPPK